MGHTQERDTHHGTYTGRYTRACYTQGGIPGHATHREVYPHIHREVYPHIHREVYPGMYIGRYTRACT